MRKVAVGAFLSALVLAGLVFAPAQVSASTVSAKVLLSRVSVASESGSSSYVRTKFKHWVDANGDCQNSRMEVLIAESKVAPTFTTARNCTVSRGKWFSYYDGATWTIPADVDIDHMVALKEAWESGARSWTAAQRQAYANDLGFGPSLVAVTDNVNQSKGDRDPAQWMPALSTCTYAIQWVQVKYRWRLTMDSAEKSKLASLLSGSCGARTVTIPGRAK